LSQDVGPKAGAVCSPVEADILRDDEIDRSSIEGRMHDFQHPTSLALPELLVQLKINGYKVVQVKAKEPVQTLAEYDQWDPLCLRRCGSSRRGRPRETSEGVAQR
jgi:hypothetical protein